MGANISLPGECCISQPIELENDTFHAEIGLSGTENTGIPSDKDAECARKVKVLGNIYRLRDLYRLLEGDTGGILKAGPILDGAVGRFSLDCEPRRRFVLVGDNAYS